MFERVVVGATDSEGATRAVRHAIEVTRVSGGTLHVVMAVRRKRHVAVAEDRRADDVGLDADEALLRRFEEMAARESVPGPDSTLCSPSPPRPSPAWRRRREPISSWSGRGRATATGG